ncbi:MAG: hypothetical protein KGQ59_11485, partial [Bdellovibrionales bacterium]|nr:hypothetical protein [Bdellovibrionales bacterium]
MELLVKLLYPSGIMRVRHIRPLPLVLAMGILAVPGPTLKLVRASELEHVVTTEAPTLFEIGIFLYGSRERWKELAEINNIQDPRSLHEGQKLRLVRPPRLSVEQGRQALLKYWRAYFGLAETSPTTVVPVAMPSSPAPVTPPVEPTEKAPEVRQPIPLGVRPVELGLLLNSRIYQQGSVSDQTTDLDFMTGLHKKIGDQFGLDLDMRIMTVNLSRPSGVTRAPRPLSLGAQLHYSFYRSDALLMQMGLGGSFWTTLGSGGIT